MKIVKDGFPYIVLPLVLLAGLGAWLQVQGHVSWAIAFYALAALNSAFMLYFFRDPMRISSDNVCDIVSGADGKVRAVEELFEKTYLEKDTVRISVYLSPFNVHVNRAPLEGQVQGLAYTPGKRLLTIQNAASEHNEHSSILIRGQNTECLVKQIVGPIVRRVVYWLTMGQELAKGDRIGIMKFGSRMDMYFPSADVEVLVKRGDRVKAGETVVARIRENAQK